MEKLTWLASERRMSQEGESEEENSQEENSEPEEEEEEEAEGMESLQKEDEMTDEAIGDPAEKPPTTFASPKTAPEVETSKSPPGELDRPEWGQVSGGLIVSGTCAEWLTYKTGANFQRKSSGSPRQSPFPQTDV